MTVVSLSLSPESVVDEGPLWTIAVNRNQDLLGKTMLVLDRPCTAVVDVSPAEWAALHDEIRRVVEALGALFSPDRVNFAFLMNQDAQVHLHVIPRYASHQEWGGRRFVDRHWGVAFGHEQQLLTPEEVGRLAGDIRALLPARSAVR